MSTSAKPENLPLPRLSLDHNATPLAISPRLFGIFFEDLNHAAEGGVYGELLFNRAMNHPELLHGWRMFCEGECDGSMGPAFMPQQNPVNSWALRLEILQLNSGRVGVRNEGFYGVPIRAGEAYTLTMDVWCSTDFYGPLLASLESINGRCYASAKVEGLGIEKNRITITITPDGTDAEACLVLSAATTGVIWCDFVSLFAQKCWKNRPWGLRNDLAEMMSALQPSFVRFPGGCYVEGDDLSQAFRWKENLGDPAQRKGHWNRWGYYSSGGIGFHEYLQLCEDLQAEALYVVNAGISHTEQLSSDDLTPWLEDTLDAIEYATGAANSTWGALRAQTHPEPFKLPFIEIGNENGGVIYQENYQRFYQEIKSRYPLIQIITNQYSPGIAADIIDEHEFANPQQFHTMYHRFDSYDRTTPKIFFGEYACAYCEKVGTLNAALAEAVFMAGMERNGDQVIMASYAPLFVHRKDRHWENDAIVFDGLQIVPTPSYEVQRLFSIRRVATIIPSAIEGAENIYSSAGYNKSGEFTVKLINVSNTTSQLEIPLPSSADWQISCEILSHENPDYTNNFINKTLQTVSKNFQQNSKKITFTIKGYSLSIITCKKT